MGFAVMPKLKHKTKYKTKELHKKFGQIIVIDPCDSDLQEGLPYVRQVWFRDGEDPHKLWLLWEEDVE